jgi:hypothetical protein
MPKVVQYTGSQVSREVVRGPRAGSVASGAFGLGGVTEGARDLAVGVAQAKQRVNTTAAEEAAVKFERDKNDMFFNPDSGYFNTQGRNAYDTAGTMQQELVKLRDTYGDTLESEEARAAYNRATDVQLMRSNVDIQRHASKGLQAWEVATIQSQTENTIESASLYYNQPDRLKVQRQLGRQSVIDSAELRGIGAEATNEELQTYNSSFSASIINAATRNSATEGKDALDQYGDVLEPADLQKIENNIAKKEKSEKEATDAAMTMTISNGLVDRLDDRGQINEEINKIDDPQLRSKVRRETMWQLDQKKKAQDERRGAIYEDVENALIDGRSVESWITSNPESWELLSPKQKRTVLSGKTITTNHAKLSELLLLPKNQLAKVEPSDHFTELAPGDRTKLTNAVKAARGEREEDPVGRTRAAQTTATMSQMFGKPYRNLSRSKQQAWNTLYSELDNELKYREGQKGGLLTSQEYTGMLNDFTRKVVEEGVLWDSEIDVTDVPSEDVPVLSRYLRDNGVPVTADNLIKAYQQASE